MAQSGVTAERIVESGLQRIIFTTGRGSRIFVNLPQDLRAGETCSGSVFGEASGKTDAERAAGNDELRNYVVEILGQKVSATGKVFKLNIPAAGTKDDSGVILRDQKGKEVAHVAFKVSLQASSRAPDFRLPTTQLGEMIQVECPCDGVIAGTDYIKIGGQDSLPIAESPRMRWAFNTNLLKGPTEIEVNEHGQVVKGKVSILGIKLTAAKTLLLRGERTTLTVEVSGLEGLKEAVPLRLENKTPGVLTMEPSNIQELTIKPAEVGPGGKYTTQRTLTGIRVGAFFIQGTVLRRDESTATTENRVESKSAADEKSSLLYLGKNPRAQSSACPTCLYAIDFDVTENFVTKLYKLDAFTGSTISVINITPSIGSCIGLELGSNGYLYAVRTHGGLSNTKSLFRIDPATGASQLIGPLGIIGGLYEGDVAFDAAGTLYATDGNRLFTVDLATGQATLKGSVPGTNRDISNLAFDTNSGALYGIDNTISPGSQTKLLRIDPNNATIISSQLITPNLGGWGGMDFDPVSGRLYVADGGPAATKKLHILNPVTGVMTPVGPITITPGLSGLALCDTGTGPTIPILGFANLDAAKCVVEITVSEPVSCSSIAANGSDFLLTAPGGAVVTGASGVGCGSFTNKIRLTYSLGNADACGAWTIFTQTGSDGNTLIDKCNNLVQAGGAVTFPTPPAVAHLAMPSDAFCEGAPIIADGSGSTEEIRHFWSVVESDANWNVIGTEYSAWFPGQAGTFDVRQFAAQQGFALGCGKYYRVKVAVQSCCTRWSESVLLIRIQCQPIADAGPDRAVCCCGPGKLQIGSPAVTGFTYSWSPTIGLDDPTSSSPTIDFSKFAGTSVAFPSVYEMTTTDSFGCSSKDSVFIKTPLEGGFPGFYLPNAFSPNGDNENDFWEAFDSIQPAGATPAYNATDYEFEVYDYWGSRIVFLSGSTTTGFTNGSIPHWDGTANKSTQYKWRQLRKNTKAGQRLQTAVYVYILRMKNCMTGWTEIRHGNISLVR